MPTTIRNRSLLAVVALAAMLTAFAVVPAQASSTATATAASCKVTWGSTAKKAQVAKYTSRSVTNLRAGRHECFDRLVIDLGPRQSTRSGQGVGYRVSYVDQVRAIGTGDRVNIAGGAFIQISVNAAAHDDKGKATYTPANRLRAVPVTNYSTFRQVAFLGSFEGQTDVAIGVRARLPMRAQVLTGPGNNARLVVDVAHRW